MHGRVLRGRLGKTVTKRFVVGERDDEMPQPGKWTLGTVAPSTAGRLKIGFGEPLDHFLVPQTLRILDPRGRRVRGRVTVVNHGSGAEFLPEERWEPGNYILVRLTPRDLAVQSEPKFDRILQKDSAETYNNCRSWITVRAKLQNSFRRPFIRRPYSKFSPLDLRFNWPRISPPGFRAYGCSHSNNQAKGCLL